ncbi:MAG: T9SS type A sorting domain-containing protein, partial [Bacteroidota bacterium]|nr:T9SS type A sorting domain-containing protein [Bacteroidota bacterium]
MKKINLFLVFIMLSITVFGQDIIIDFAGSGASSEVTTVEVVNLSNGTSIEVSGENSLNVTTGTVGVEEFENLESNSISSYPNPFENLTNIEFYVNQNDFVTVTICDITGKIVANYGKELTAGVHSFEFTANNLGMYFINVSGTNFVQSSKVICLSNNSQQAQLSYNEQTTEILPEKSYKSGNSKDFSFTVGDTLKLKGIS